MVLSSIACMVPPCRCIPNTLVRPIAIEISFNPSFLFKVTRIKTALGLNGTPVK